MLDPAAASHVSVLGTTHIGRYVLLGELGRGAMGIVFRARDAHLDRDVAIKVLPGTAQQEERTRFLREARAVARLRHPGIVSVHEVGQHDGRPFIVMDLVDGRSLAETGAVTPRRAAELARDLALALEHAHAAGIVHRDVKPGNVLLGGDGKALLADFGLAKTLDAGGSLTASGAMVGTPQYASPEQLRAENDRVGPRSDVYGLGGVLYWELTGRPPFDGETVIEVVRRALVTLPTPPRRIEPRIHPDLETITLRCLEKDPEQRYASAAEVAADLDRFLGGEAIRARPVGAIGRVARWVRRHPIRACLYAGATLAAIAALGGGIATIEAQRRRATRAAHEALIGPARAEAEQAWADLDASRARALDGGAAEAGVGRLDERLAAGLRAWRAAARWHGLAPTETTARERAFEAALALGEIAQQAEQWSLADTVFAEAEALEIDRARARRARDGLRDARARVLREREAAVEAILARARSGELAARATGLDDVVFGLVRYSEPQTVRILAAALDEVSEAILSARREVLLAAGTPTDEERAAGLEPLVGLEAAVERHLAADIGDAPTEADRELLARAAERLSRRELARRPVAGGIVPDVRELVAARVNGRLATAAAGEDLVTLARLCCEALGRIGIEQGAVGPLVRYLGAEADEARAAAAGIALCRLGTDEAFAAVTAAANHRFRSEGTFRREMVRVATQLGVGVTTDLPGIGPARISTNPTGTITMPLGPAAELVARGSQLHETGRNEAALEPLTAAIDRFPGCAPAWYFRGIAHAALERHGAALADLGRAIELDPGFSLAWSARGVVRLACGDPAGALVDHDRAVELGPFQALAWARRAHVRMLRGELVHALVDLDRAISMAPDNAEWLRMRGESRLAFGDTVGAQLDLDRAIALAPADAVAWGLRGVARGRSGNLAGALSDLSRAIELAPASVQAAVNRAVVRRDAGDVAGAIADCDRALALQPDEPQALFIRATALAAAGRGEEALADLRRCVARQPAHADAWGHIGLIEAGLGRREAALAAYGRAIEIDPAHLMAWNNRGGVRRDLGDLEGALADFTRAIEIQPRAMQAWLNRVELLLQRGDATGALGDLDRMMSLAPELPLVHFRRAAVRAAVGDRDGARADLEAFLARAAADDPDRDPAAKLLAELRGAR